AANRRIELGRAAQCGPLPSVRPSGSDRSRSPVPSGIGSPEGQRLLATLALATLVDDVQQASPQQAQPLPAFDAPALAVTSQVEAGQVQPSPQQVPPALVALATLAALASFSQHDLDWGSAALADLVAVVEQHAASPQQSQPLLVPAFAPSQVQAEQ